MTETPDWADQKALEVYGSMPAAISASLDDTARMIELIAQALREARQEGIQAERQESRELRATFR